MSVLNSIKKGIFTEKYLVEKLSTPSVVKKYLSKGFFQNKKDKDRFLEELDRYCKFNYDEKNNKYAILEVNKMPIPKKYAKLNGGMYQFTVPLLLNKLLLEKDENNKTEMPLTYFNWAININMINSNYNLVKYNINTSSDLLGVSEEIIFDFIDKTSNSINYYITHTLKALESLSMITVFTHRIISKTTVDDELEVDGKHIKIEYKHEKRVATDEEVDLTTSLIEKAMKDADINPINEKYMCYYGWKSKIYKEALAGYFYEKDINYVYDTYSIFINSKERIIDFLGNYNVTDYNKLNQNFNDFFIENIKSNSNKSFDKIIKELKENSQECLIENILNNKNEYCNGYDNLSEVTIKKDADNLYLKMREKNKFNGNGKDKMNFNKDDKLDYNIVFVKKE